MKLHLVRLGSADADYGPAARRHAGDIQYVHRSSNQPEGAPRPRQVPSGRDGHHEKENRCPIYQDYHTLRRPTCSLIAHSAFKRYNTEPYY
jgi:hypothetical protein